MRSFQRALCAMVRDSHTCWEAHNSCLRAEAQHFCETGYESCKSAKEFTYKHTGCCHCESQMAVVAFASLCSSAEKKQPSYGFDRVVSAADVALASRDEKQRAWIAGLPSIHDCRGRVVSHVHHTIPVLASAVAAEVVPKLLCVDRSAVKRERRFRNVMRARGGRVRTNEEMCGGVPRAIER